MNFVIDIDDTLLFSEKIECQECGRVKYKLKRKDDEEIRKLNDLWGMGHRIILYTGRNWDCYDITVKQLSEAGIQYDELVMGKPQGVYVDKDAKTTLPEVRDVIDSTAKKRK